MLKPAAWLGSPTVRATRLISGNALRRRLRAAAAAAALLPAAALLARLTPLGRAVTTAVGAPVAVLVLTGIVLATLILRRRRRLAAGLHRYWLGALPRDLPLTLRAAGGPVAGWCAVAALAVAAAAGAQVPTGVLARGALSSAAGVAAAVVLVALLSSDACARWHRTRGKGRALRSRYAEVRRVRPHWATRPSVWPLGFWPLAMSRFSDRPTVRARSLLPVLLALPLDVTGTVALALVAVWLVSLHLVNLLLSVVRVAFSASWWLAPTPLTPMRFAIAVAHRALAGQIASCALLVAIARVTAGPHAFRSAVGLSCLWIVSACLLSAVACSAALRNRSMARSMRQRWAR